LRAVQVLRGLVVEQDEYFLIHMETQIQTIFKDENTVIHSENCDAMT
jgi:hypothetical protein